MKIIVDAMGGDNAPKALVEGALLASADFGCNITLVGDEQVIRSILNGRGQGTIDIVHASQSIDMEEKATSAIRGKKDSSLSIAMNLLAEGRGDGLVTAGNTGAALSGATLIVKRIKGIRRAALAPMLPTKKGKSLLVDCGANVECTPEYLLQFAFLGHQYMKSIAGMENPKIGLINNGAEETKGTELQTKAYALLKEASDAGRINFVGNIEGRDIPEGHADVLVCDGFTGNIVLKTIEGVAMFFMGEIKDILTQNLKTKLAALAIKPGLKKLKNKMDYKEIGGAPMLGISKPVIKAHGSCDERAVKSAIFQAISFVESRYVDHVAENIQHMVVAKEEKE